MSHTRQRTRSAGPILSNPLQSPPPPASCRQTPPVPAVLGLPSGLLSASPSDVRHPTPASHATPHPRVRILTSPFCLTSHSLRLSPFNRAYQNPCLFHPIISYALIYPSHLSTCARSLRSGHLRGCRRRQVRPVRLQEEDGGGARGGPELLRWWVGPNTCTHQQPLVRFLNRFDRCERGRAVLCTIIRNPHRDNPHHNTPPLSHDAAAVVSTPSVEKSLRLVISSRLVDRKWVAGCV